MKYSISIYLLGLLSLLFLGCQESGKVGTIAHSEDEVRAVLDAQVAAWNEGDIPAFMETYLKTDDLRFSSGGQVKRGWQSTYERYITTYPNKDAMGYLRFEELEVTFLGEGWAQVHGRYRLQRTGDYSNATGLFTLLLQLTEDGWKILHDHTSAG